MGRYDKRDALRKSLGERLAERGYSITGGFCGGGTIVMRPKYCALVQIGDDGIYITDSAEGENRVQADIAEAAKEAWADVEQEEVQADEQQADANV